MGSSHYKSFRELSRRNSTWWFSCIEGKWERGWVSPAGSGAKGNLTNTGVKCTRQAHLVQLHQRDSTGIGSVPRWRMQLQDHHGMSLKRPGKWRMSLLQVQVDKRVFLHRPGAMVISSLKSRHIQETSRKNGCIRISHLKVNSQWEILPDSAHAPENISWSEGDWEDSHGRAWREGRVMWKACVTRKPQLLL